MNKKLLDIIKRYYAIECTTQKQVAELCGLPESIISLIWRGDRKLTIDTLGKLCKAVDVKAWEVLKEAGE